MVDRLVDTQQLQDQTTLVDLQQSDDALGLTVEVTDKGMPVAHAAAATAKH